MAEPITDRVTPYQIDGDYGPVRKDEQAAIRAWNAMVADRKANAGSGVKPTRRWRGSKLYRRRSHGNPCTLNAARQKSSPRCWVRWRLSALRQRRQPACEMVTCVMIHRDDPVAAETGLHLAH